MLTMYLKQICFYLQGEKKEKIMKKKLFMAALIATTMTFAACGGSSKHSDAANYSNNYSAAEVTSEEAYDGGYYEEAPAAATNNGEMKEADKLNDSARKLIKTYNMSVETEVFDELIVNIENQINALGGYIQNLDTYNGSNYSGRSNKYSNMTVRIPARSLESFINFVGNAANVTNKNLSVEDVTLRYVDVETRKNTYQVEMDRLLSFLEKAETMDDIITLESRLSEVRYNLESMEAQLRTYDNLVDYATVYINISEVTKYTPPTPVSYGERVARSFTNSVTNLWEGLKDFFVGFVGALPGLVLFAIIVTIIVFIIKALIKAQSKKNLAKEAMRMNNAIIAQQNAQMNAMQHNQSDASENKN